MEILSQIFQFLLSNILPSGLIMFIGWLMLFLSQGGGGAKVGGNINVPKVKKYYLWGWRLIFIGLFWTIAVILLQAWDSYPSQVEEIAIFISRNITQILFVVKTPQFALLVGIIGLFVMCVLQMIERGYKINLIPSTEKDEGFDRYSGYMQIENVGFGEKMYCCAKLTSISKKEFGERKFRSIDTSELNPLGRYLAWIPNSQWVVEIHKGLPRILDFIRADIDKRPSLYGPSKVTIYFAGYESSPNIGLGEFIVEIEFLRKKGKKLVHLSTIEKSFRVDTENNITWIEQKREKNEKQKARKTKK